jgi:hypothetical protein
VRGAKRAIALGRPSEQLVRDDDGLVGGGARGCANVRFPSVDAPFSARVDLRR